MEELKFVRCPETKNVFEAVYIVDESKLDLLTANSTDAAGEKHVPVVNQDGNKVEVVVGSVEHPMTEEHYIPFIVVQTDKRVLRKDLTPDCEPKASFLLEDGEKFVRAYEYCNLHGLWKAE
ncbi:desulfoferrodoxin family protein [Peptococcus simiae]|uniref:Desulfoferrodoxin family protein n=1 Tax=Peptococcus simiae TaxID=1643805 RepID=A0ABW9GZ51_9FIRM